MHEEWIKNSEPRQRKLEEALRKYKGNDGVVQYEFVAFSFPSDSPLENSFNIPKIDFKTFQEWATQNGWEVSTTTDMLIDREGYNLPLIRFKRI